MLEIDEGRILPDVLLNFFAGDQPAASLDEKFQDTEGLRLQFLEGHQTYAVHLSLRRVQTSQSGTWRA
jgi:hypothetical protein